MTACDLCPTLKYLAFKDSKLLVDNRIAALVATGAIASRALNILYDRGHGERSDEWFYLLPDFNVHHDTSRNGIHQFRTIETIGDVVAIVAEIMSLTLEDTTLHNYVDKVEIPQALFREVQVLKVAGQIQDAHEILVKNGIPADVARNLLGEAHYYQFSLCVAENAVATGAGFLVLVVDSDLWLIEPDSALTKFYMCSGYDVLSLLTDLLESSIG